jgi:two-component system chemotaxis sensor kinase CheA
VTDRLDFREFIGGFVAEAEELVSAAHALLLEIEASNGSGALHPRAVRDLFRAIHTIKGLAGMVAVEPIVEISHALETLLRNADQSGGQLQRGTVDVSLQAVNAIGERVRAVADGRVPAPAPDALLAALAEVKVTADAPIAPARIAPEWDARLSPGERQQLLAALRTAARVWTLSFVPSEANAARGVTIATVRARLAALGDIIKVAPRTLSGDRKGVAFDFLMISDAAPEALAEAAATTAELVAPIAAPAAVAAAPEREAGPALDAAPVDAAPIGRPVVRVELARLDDLQEQLSLLNASRFRLEREVTAQADRGTDVRRLRELVDLQVRQLRDLRRAILRVRMVRLSEVLEPLSLLVRSLTRPDQKEVRLEIDARDSEIDKAVADRLLPALVHLLRNAIDHAIEPVDERVASGKPRAGSLRVSCQELGGSRLELVIRDDGRGIDRDAIARRARRPVATDEDLLDVLTTPGFSTRDTATSTSGRGLGMDIVKRVAVTELGGELGITTALGEGTSFRLRVPLTIAIIEVFSFACGPQAFVVPVAAVEEIFELSHDDLVRPPAGAGSGVVTLLIERRGRAMPLVPLGALLAIAPGDAARKAIVIRRNGAAIAFAVDRMLGRHEVVVRPTADPLTRAPGIAGATDLGDGRPTLVLDLSELGAHVAAHGGSA